jgi:uncharacterized repeat protein (TIGR01451 family)
MKTFNFFQSLFQIALIWCFALGGTLFAQGTGGSTPTVNQNGIFLQKLVSNSTIPSGVGFTYTIQYSIPAGTSGFLITDNVPGSLIIDNVIALPGACGTPVVSTVGNAVTYGFSGTVANACVGSFQVNVHFPAGTTCNGEVARNNACVSGTTPNGAVQNLCTEFVSTTAQASDPWKISKTPIGATYVGGSCKYAVTTGDTVHYQLQVSKTPGLYGFINMVNAVVYDTLPAGAVPVAASLLAGTTWDALNNRIIWLPGFLDATLAFNTKTTNFKVKYNVTPPTSVFNKASLFGTLGTAVKKCADHYDADSSCVRLTLPVPPTTSANIHKWVYASGNSVGCSGYYDVYTVNNGGTVLSSFNVTDNIPTGITVTGVQLIRNTSASATTVTLGTPYITSATGSTAVIPVPSLVSPAITINQTAGLVPGGYVWLRIYFTINGSAPATITNCATLTGAATGTACASLAIYPPTPKPCLYKELCNKQTSYTQGQIIRYRLRVQNIGSGTMTSTTLTDVLNPNLQYLGGETYYSSNALVPTCNPTSGTTPWTATPSHAGNNLQWSIPAIGAQCSSLFYANCGQYGTAGVPFHYIEFNVKIIDTAGIGVVPNLFTLSGGNLSSAVNSNIEYLTINANHSFSATKRVSKDGGATYLPTLNTAAAATVRYRLGITNLGSAIKNITYIDMLPRDASPNDYLMLSRATSRGSQFDVPFIGSAASTPLLTAATNFDAGSNICLPEMSYSPGGCTPPTWVGTSPSKNVKAGFAGWLLTAQTQNYDFNAQVSPTALPGQRACNSFAARGAYNFIFNYVNTVVQTAPIESGTACIGIDSVVQQNCCEKVRIAPTDNPCCSRLVSLDTLCRIKSVKVTLIGGTFTSLAWGCAPAPTGFVGLSTYTLNAAGSCTNPNVTACFQATGSGLVTVQYTVTFADGTTCVKEEIKKCCCKPKVNVQSQVCAGKPVTFSVVPTNCQFTGGVWNFGDGTPTSTILNTTHIYTAPGTYTATFSYTNECGQQTLTFTVIIVQCPCVIKPCFSYYGLGLNFSFNASPSTANYPISAYHWDFGDGTYGVGVNPTHAFPAPGTYVVCVTVYVDMGKGPCDCMMKFCRTIVVKPAGTLGYGVVCPKKIDPTGGHTSSDATTTSSQTRSAAQEGTDATGYGEMKVFPNPFDSQIEVQLNGILTEEEAVSESGKESQFSLKMRNVQGQIVWEKEITKQTESVKIDGTRLPAGLYLVSLQRDGEVITSMKVVKQ